jgi:hypothetical protein
VHVSCAQNADFHLGFEMVPVKSDSHHHKTIPSGAFEDSHLYGQMIPSIWCKHHDVSRKKIVRLTDRDVDGKVGCRAHNCRLLPDADAL